MPQRERESDWAEEVPWNRGHGPYEDYGWEPGDSIIPEFRDPSVHNWPYDYERERQEPWRTRMGNRPRRYRGQRGAGQYSNADWQGRQQWQSRWEPGAEQRERDREIWRQGNMPPGRYSQGRTYAAGGHGEREDWNVTGPYYGYGPRGYHRSDERINDDVCERLTQHGGIDASNMNVDVNDGEVTLMGQVPDRRMKRMAESVAESVSGVWDVRNELRVNRGDRGNQGNQENQGDQELRAGKGRKDVIGRTGVYPASGPMPEGNAEYRGMASWGQGDRGEAGYKDSGGSEPWYTQEDLKEVHKEEGEG